MYILVLAIKVGWYQNNPVVSEKIAWFSSDSENPNSASALVSAPIDRRLNQYCIPSVSGSRPRIFVYRVSTYFSSEMLSPWLFLNS